MLQEIFSALIALGAFMIGASLVAFETPWWTLALVGFGLVILYIPYLLVFWKNR